MGGVERKPRHPPHSQSRAEPVDEIGEIRSFVRAIPADLLRILALHRKRRKPDDVKAIAGVEWVIAGGGGDGFDAFAKQPCDQVGLA